MKDFGGKDDEDEYEDDDAASCSSSDLFELDHLAAYWVPKSFDGAKQKALKAVSILKGVKSITLDMKDQKMTVIGYVDPVDIVRKLRKLCSTEILSVGPAEEEKKKEEPKKDKKEKEPLKEEPKKEKETEKEEPKKDKEEKEPEKEEPKKDEKKEAETAELVKAYQAYNPYMTRHYFVKSAEEDPSACAIC